MAQLIVFDLDGVLTDTREIHFDALNRSLAEIGAEFVIGRDEHLSRYDGLPTRAKLVALTAEKGLPESEHDRIWKRKQELTVEIIHAEMRPDPRVAEILKRLRGEGQRIYVASNAVRETVKMILLRKGLMEYVEHFLCNEDVAFPKPNPEMYLRCMIHAGVAPADCLVVEDSHVGRQAALASGAALCGVRDPSDLSYEKVRKALDRAQRPGPKRALANRWEDPELNVVIPMAGAGSRFEQAGYTFPKPLIEVVGKPMIQVVVDNLGIDAHYIFVVQKEHYERYNLSYLLNLIAPGCSIVQIEGMTGGAACTTLAAADHINNEQPLLIVNSDQFVEWESSRFMYSMVGDGVDGGIATFSSTHPKWSFAAIDETGFVSEVAEKRPISSNATVGIYYWKQGCDYVHYARQMIDRGIQTNNEFYVCPVFNEAVQDGKRIKISEVDHMWGLGTPEDLQYFLNHGAHLLSQ